MDLVENLFYQLPSAVYKLKVLKKLDISSNSKLTRIDKSILQLKSLEELDCKDSNLLTFPPYAVCEQGLAATRKYISDYSSEKGVNLIQVPVSFVGEALAGKTSVIKSLQTGKRMLTKRTKTTQLDETTKVFKVEELELKKCSIKILDHGGHEVYHLVYQMLIREQCVPVVVVNMERFKKLSKTNGSKEATKYLCFNWLSHLYLACPKLGPPILVLTHTDMLLADEYEEAKKQLLLMAEILRREVLDEERRCSSTSSRAFTPVKHLRNTDQDLFHPDDIFEFSNDRTETSSIKSLKKRLASRCSKFTMRLPLLWEKVEKFIEQQSEEPYIALNTVTTEFENDDPQIILEYMHNSGRILWFKKEDTLSKYIFHRTTVITEIIALLFYHSADKQWEQRVNDFVAFDHRGERIDKSSFESFIEQFTKSEVLDEALLLHLFNDSSNFDSKVALALLKHFFILHGPITHNNRWSYILPYFSSTFMESDWETDKYIQLRVDLMIRGLNLPWYVFQLVTVAVLNHSLDEFDNPSVKKNGLTIQHGESATHLVHDFNNSKITVQVSTPVKLLGPSWELLVKTVLTILNLISKTWKACHVEVLIYCAHCLFLRDVKPAYAPNPKWFQDINKQKSSIDDLKKKYSGIEPVPCERCQASDLSVPKPLRFPCKYFSLLIS